MNGAFWRGRRVLVTGATGVVGSWLVKRLLATDASVVALVRDADPQTEFYRSGDYKRTSIVQGRVEDFWTLERCINEHEVQTIFHLAAQPIVSVAQRFPLQTFESNVRGTYNLLEACRIHEQFVESVIVASSDKAYGEQTALPYTETLPLEGRHPYEVSKSCADLITHAYYHTYGLPVAVARCGNIFGGGDLNWSRLVPGTVRSFLRRERPVIRSDGTYVRDYIFVDDVVAAYVRLAECIDDEHVRGGAFNFSLEQPVTVLDLVGRIQEAMRCADIEPDVRNEASGEIHSQYLDSTKAREVLAWAPRLSLDEGLARTIKWYREFLASEAGEDAGARTGLSA